MTCFALVHGGAHGGWCWERVVPELERRGHTAVTPDLPFEDQTAGAQRWAETVVTAIDAVAPGDPEVVVVGHSLAGLCVPIVAATRPVRRMVLLGALVPRPGSSASHYLAEHPECLTIDTERGGAVGPAGISWEAARYSFYGDCDEATARAAFQRLRPTASAAMTEQSPLDAWPDTPCTSIVMTEDRVVSPAWSRRAAVEIGAELVEIDGCGHSPFYSRPGELADVLVAWS